jgi:hypothetical protein
MAVTNFPDSQDVVVTNPSSSPVPVELRQTRAVTVNSFTIDIAAGETEVFEPELGFHPVDAFFVSATGADRGMSIELYNRNETVMHL